ncbi:metallophosphoesterase family protein [Paludisphaera mucosa]|uniref:Metallophosphoesterase n=1 Tax=Paludisphaera mucosa TaxID=3030827 RepID=A0ABT6FM50_9BACT|nr:metallophosphoesterase [Paludisphaera mucosa]
MDQIVLFHVSDIHMSNVLDNTDFSGNEGYWGHHRILATGLKLGFEHAIVKTSLTDDQPLWVVVSGDLTQRGSTSEFHVAHTLLQSKWVSDPEGLQVAGLEIPSKHIFMVPGNHDHWNGWKRRKITPWNIRPPAHNSTLVPGNLPETPWRQEIRQGGLMLEIFGIDSNSGLQDNAGNLRAGGSYARGELRGLIRCLNRSDAEGLPDGVRRRIRVLVSHHGLISNRNFQWYRDALPLDPTSQGLLQRLAFRRGIDVVLTGHYHDFFLSPFRLAKGLKSSSLIEIRAPSATQGKPENHKQGFLVHQIQLTESPTMVDWKVWSYLWYQGRFIVTSGTTAHFRF